MNEPKPSGDANATTAKAKIAALVVVFVLLGAASAQVTCLDVLRFDTLRQPARATLAWGEVISVRLAVLSDRAVSASEVDALLASLEEGVSTNRELAAEVSDFTANLEIEERESEFSTGWRLRLAGLGLESGYLQWAYVYRSFADYITSDGIGVLRDFESSRLGSSDKARSDMREARLYMHMAEISCRLDELAEQR